VEEKKKRSTVAIDFGTSNTFISRCPPDSLQPTPVLLESGYLGIETAVLFRPGKKNMIGAQAVQTWGNEEPQKRKGMDLRLGFKPEIHRSERSQEAAREFFSGLLRYGRESRVPLTGEYIDLYMGVPSNIGESYKKALADIADDAGLSPVNCKDEPLGALLYHLSIQDITPSETMGGVLIVDFGGGTCDFALMQQLEIIDSWGDSMLGGRLFDDLFFQWLIEENPGAREAMASEGADFFIHWQRCRELKESFSNFMSIHREEKWSGRVPYYGQIRGASWEDFIQRASNYTPSEEFRGYLQEIGREDHRLFEEESINLIQWFSSEFKKALTHQVPLHKVILCGGSSLWPFVGEVIERSLRLPPEAVLRSDNPYAVISQGLSLLPNLERRLQKAQADLQEDLPRLMEKQVKAEIIDPIIDKMVDSISRRVSTLIVDEKLRDKLLEFRDSGGSLSELEAGLAAEIEISQEELGQAVNREIEKVMERLQLKLSREIRDWFQEKGGIKPITVRGREEKPGYRVHLQQPDLYEGSLLGKIDTIMRGLTGIILFIVFEALITVGPVGLASGLIVALIIPFLGLRRSREKIKQIKLSPKISRVVFSRKMIDYTINRTRKQISREVKKELAERMQKPQEQLLEEINETIEREINSLSQLSAL